MWQFLDKEPSGALASTVEEAGGDSLDGRTRKLVVEQLEGLRHESLTRALANHPDREARHSHSLS